MTSQDSKVADRPGAGRAKVPSAPTDPSHHLGRGASAYRVWLFGARALVEVRGQPRVECSFADLLATGFTTASAASWGPAVEKILAALRQLEPLPDAPIEHRVTVGRCKGCGRGWTYVASGDPHYSYRYEVWPFPRA